MSEDHFLAVAAQKDLKTIRLSTEPGPEGTPRGSDHGPAGLGEHGSPGQAKAYPTWGMLQLACRATARPAPRATKGDEARPAMFFNRVGYGPAGHRKR